MSNKHRNHTRVPPPGPPKSSSQDWAKAEVQIQSLIAAQHSKAALEGAKEVHKAHGTAASEALLILAYEARIRDLLKHGMLIEANSLLTLVIQKFPVAHARLEELSLELSMNQGNLDMFVAPLGDSPLAPATRRMIETAIRERVCDLEALAQARSLPPNHNLRQAAMALTSAFSAVTSRALEPAELLLPEVSHASPLAPWKALVNAIAAFYRRDDRGCKKWLGTIPKDCVPARLVPVIHAMLGSLTTVVENPAAQRLMASTGTGGQVLRNRLTALESAFARKKPQEIAKLGAVAVSACQQFRPDLVPKLRQSIAARCLVLEFRQDQLRAAIAGSIPVNANWYRLAARAMETSGSDVMLACALFAWYEFRSAALEEKWFRPNSLEDGVLWLHMATIAAEVPADVVEDLIDGYYELPWRVKKRDLASSQLLSPNLLYEKACEADPHPEAFRAWLAWAKRRPHPWTADRAAEAWRSACPRDVAPLLWLMESSEKRSAYQKSLNYLEEAEQLDRLNPEVRRAKLRLLVASAVRHFRQRKAHLAAREISQIEAAAGKDPNLLVLVKALHTVSAALEPQDRDQVRQQVSALEAQLGNPAAAHMLLRAVLKASALPEETLPHLRDINSHAAGVLLKGLATACALADAVGIHVFIPDLWEDRLMAALSSPELSFESFEILVLGEAAIRSRASKLAFALSTSGLKRSGADARFLFLRARALPTWAGERSYECLCAALQLARRDRDSELVARLLAFLDEHKSSHYGWKDSLDEFGPEGHSLAPAELSRVLEQERAAQEFPESSFAAARVPRQDRTEDPFEDDDDEDFEDLVADLPEDVARELRKAMARGASLEEILKYILFGNFADCPLEELTRFLPPELAREIKKLAAEDAPWKEVREARNVLADANWRKPELPERTEKKTPKVVDARQQSLF